MGVPTQPLPPARMVLHVMYSSVHVSAYLETH